MHDVADTTDIRWLVVNADDFGFTTDINRGIMKAFTAGGLRSASIMVNMPGFDDAVRHARVAGNALGVGLHLTLTAGRPLTAAPSLVDERTGSFLRLPLLLARALMGGVNAREVADECAAQIGRARAAGLRLTHLDGHHHVHLVPGIWNAVRPVVHDEGIRVVRRPIELSLGGSRAGRRRLPARTLVALFARGVGPREEWSVATTDHFVGSALLGAPDFQQLLEDTLDTLQPGTTELMVHPGYVPEPLPGGDSYLSQREVELRALTAPGVLSRLRNGRVRLVHFGELT